MRKILITFLSVGICGLLAYALWDAAPVISEEDDDHEHHHDFVHFDLTTLEQHGITTQKVSSGKLQNIIRAPAKIIIAYDQIAHILPKVSGIALKAYKNLGQSVQADEVLALLESKEMAEVKTLYLTALKREQLTESNYLREKNLFDKKISSTQDYNAAKNTWEEAFIDLELARQKLYTLGLNEQEIKQLPSKPSNELRSYELRSPISGDVISRHFALGELVNENQEVYVVADLSKVWAEINVFSKDRQHVRQGQTITVTTNDGQLTSGTIIYLSPIIDEHTRTAKAIAEIDNRSGTWLPGTFVQAELMTGETKIALAVPKDAIQNIEGENAVFVASKDGFAVRLITLGHSDDLYFEIVDGLAPGEIIANKNTFLLKAELQKDEAEHMD